MSQSYRLRAGADVKQFWTTQSGLCALCGKPMLWNRFEASHASVWAKQRATIDHIIPRSKGGTDAPENLQLAHAICNKMKGNRT